MTCKKDGFTLAHQNHVSSSRKRVGHGVGTCRKCGNEGGHATTGDDGNGNRLSFKKGPWTAEEDALLIEYVKNHGERHWNCVQNTGLMRCGKSCRLRWTNHLRPNLKKGTFSPEEERVVLDLHAKLGNKWSKIAAQLPGRTDNEVKNFWNTKIKRRMKANLLTINSEENPLKRVVTFRQHLQPSMDKKSQIQQEISSIPNSLYTSNSFISSLQNPTLIPSTPSLHEQQDLGKINLNLINSSEISDPILSFLNNPSYKFQLFPKEDEENYNVGSVPIPFSSIPKCELSTISSNTSHDLPRHSHPHLISSDVGSSNALFLRKIAGSTSTTCTNMDLPSRRVNYQYFPMILASEEVTTRYGLNDVHVTSSMGKTSELEKSPITKEAKHVANVTPYDKGRETTITLEGHLISNARILDDHSYEYSYNEVMKPKEEELEELVSMDDDLSSLLYDFSTNSSSSPFNHSNGGLSKFISREEASNTPITNTNNPPTTFSISSSIGIWTTKVGVTSGECYNILTL